MTKLKPCPFCGGYARQGYDAGHIVCLVCGGAYFARPRDAEGAIKGWNRRVDHVGDATEMIPIKGTRSAKMAECAICPALDLCNEIQDKDLPCEDIFERLES